MVYTIQESLACVFVAVVAGSVAFMLSAATLLVGEALRHAYLALQEVGGVVSRLVEDCCAGSIEGGRKVPTRDVRSPMLPATVTIFAREEAKS